ncbi:MAG: hypothetical protein JWR26_697 [Pedosphaera sp.]|nr:hypothetical protein [Pedosphaera sp.]
MKPGGRFLLDGGIERKSYLSVLVRLRNNRECNQDGKANGAEDGCAANDNFCHPSLFQPLHPFRERGGNNPLAPPEIILPFHNG